MKIKVYTVIVNDKYGEVYCEVFGTEKEQQKYIKTLLEDYGAKSIDELDDRGTYIYENVQEIELKGKYETVL